MKLCHMWIVLNINYKVIAVEGEWMVRSFLASPAPLAPTAGLWVSGKWQGNVPQ